MYVVAEWPYCENWYHPVAAATDESRFWCTVSMFTADFQSPSVETHTSSNQIVRERTRYYLLRIPSDAVYKTSVFER